MKVGVFESTDYREHVITAPFFLLDATDVLEIILM
jgi:hypothetical protein